MWVLVNVSHLLKRNGFGRPQGPTDLCIEQPLNVLQSVSSNSLSLGIVNRRGLL